MASRDKKHMKSSSGKIGGIRTLSDLNRPSSHDSDSDSDGPQEYYTGGEKSGMLVQDPSKRNDVDAIFNKVRQLGATQGSLENVLPSSSSTRFTGTGRTLTGESSQPNAPQAPESVLHHIVFWRNGFTINGGPLRRFDDPENEIILQSIQKSECPKELEPADKRAVVHLNLIKRENNCPEPETHDNVPFQGIGRTLGGSSSQATSEPTALDTAPSPSTGSVIDESLPSTSVQLRLANGTRMVARFNNHHTVGDIRAFIDASRPGVSQSYQLYTGFPPKILSDTTQTIEEAGLLNSVIIQT
ncbi:unnamed protein product [Cuscuta epithymum]|uniref:Uncharacterized protein n=1 Tax=Cuscuta epithymum TaxID=186058 RepID=A0AAV0EQL6_9ASTE|nr:unnamed protein product [Cuscuta epithymum]CAH9125515.1 unnamed protein product [Cuscuta epithymum]